MARTIATVCKLKSVILSTHKMSSCQLKPLLSFIWTSSIFFFSHHLYLSSPFPSLCSYSSVMVGRWGVVGEFGVLLNSERILALEIDHTSLSSATKRSKVFKGTNTSGGVGRSFLSCESESENVLGRSTDSTDIILQNKNINRTASKKHWFLEKNV